MEPKDSDELFRVLERLAKEWRRENDALQKDRDFWVTEASREGSENLVLKVTLTDVRATLAAVREAAEQRLRSSHSTPCVAAPSHGFPCSCGHDRLADVLAGGVR